MSMPAIFAAALGMDAPATDLRDRTEPSWLTCLAILCGLRWHGITGGLRGSGFSLAGTVMGFGSLLVFFLLGGMGGSDVNLLAAFGALVGSGSVFEALIWIALPGGVGAAATVFWRLRNGRARRSGAARGDYIPRCAGHRRRSLAYALGELREV